MYSAAYYVEMLLIYGECGRNARPAARMYTQRFPNRNHPNHKVILSAIARIIETHFTK
jgi:coenzyme F420-reducing hydrogenase alpha subunit